MRDENELLEKMSNKYYHLEQIGAIYQNARPTRSPANMERNLSIALARTMGTNFTGSTCQNWDLRTTRREQRPF